MEARYLTDLEWRICHAVNIYVFRNGRDGEQPVLVHIPPSKKKNMKTVMGVIQDRVKYPVGYAKYLYKMDGTRVRDPCELEMYNNYVVASNFDKHYKCAAYGRKRSPLLVLNRESKHVRVLKLQNQNYYEWLLKKKAVGEERPPYIYPPYFTHENKLPQDLPAGQMGNYNPGEIHAPGCCYPPPDCGSKTYRLGSNPNYVVNTVTLDVAPPNFRDTVPLIEFRDKNKTKQKSNDYLLKSTKYVGGRSHGKMVEPTPSDMINANVRRSSDAQSGSSSQAGISVTISSAESDDHLKSQRHRSHCKKSNRKQHQQCQHRQHKSKSQRQVVRVVSSEEYRQQQQRHSKKQVVSESSTLVTQSSEEVVQRKSNKQHHRHHHETCQSHKKKSKLQNEGQSNTRKSAQLSGPGLMTFLEFGLPPPPSQFRDNTHSDEMNKQQFLNYTRRTSDDTNGNDINVPIAAAPQKAFFYSPEKLAEINAAGNIQPLQLGFEAGSCPVSQQSTPSQQVNPPNPSAVPTQWTILPQQQSPQFVQQVYAIETQPGGPGTPTTTTLIPAHNIDTGMMDASYGMSPTPQGQLQQTPQLITKMALPQGSLQPVSSQQTFYQSNPIPSATTTAPCIIIPNNLASCPGTQLFALPSTLSQNHLQQVYQLGIVQQPNPQTCIQVDAKAMRQYVDNQKLIECRFQQHRQQIPVEGLSEENRYNHSSKDHRSRQQQRLQKSNGVTTEVTESEVDIPFTPLKTYRLENPPHIHETLSQSSSNGQHERFQNPNRYRNERLPKVKSRNVAIQMGYPANERASGNGSGRRELNEYVASIRNLKLEPRGTRREGKFSRISDASFSVDSNSAHCNKSRSDNLANNNLISQQHLCPSFSSLMKAPKDERERFFLQNTSGASSGSRNEGLKTIRKYRENFCTSYSDQHIGKNNFTHNSNHHPLRPCLPTNTNPFSRRPVAEEPLLEDLVTIPPPSEFRGYPLHSTRHQRDHHLDNSQIANRSSDHVHEFTNMFPENSSNNSKYPSDLVEHSMYPYIDNDRSSQSQQYMYSRCQYP